MVNCFMSAGLGKLGELMLAVVVRRDVLETGCLCLLQICI